MNRLIAIPCLALVVAVAGCGGTKASEDPQGSTSSLPASDTPSSGTTSASPSTPIPSSSASTTGVAPANGPLVNGVQVSLHVPAGWRVTRGEAEWQSAFDSDNLSAEGELLEHPGASGTATPGTLAKMAKDWEAVSSHDIRWRRLADVTIAGLPAYHIRGTESGGIQEDQYGTVLNHRDLVLDFTWETDWTSAAQRQRITDQILASVTLKQ